MEVVDAIGSVLVYVNGEWMPGGSMFPPLHFVSMEDCINAIPSMVEQVKRFIGANLPNLVDSPVVGQCYEPVYSVTGQPT